MSKTSKITAQILLVIAHGMRVCSVFRNLQEAALQVLILLPMRNIAYRVISRLLSLAQKETRSDSIQGKSRFQEDFGPHEEEKEDEAKTRHHNHQHKVLFHGNTDDHFRLGIKLTR